MTQKQKAYKKSLIQKIHISQKYQEYYKDNKDVYYDLLQNNFKVESSKDMNLEQLIIFCDWLSGKREDLPTISPIKASSLQVKTINSLWAEVAKNKTEEALRAFVHRVTRNNYISTQSISKMDATKVILALKKMKG